MSVYRCPIHQRWVDSAREAGCPQCLAAGGSQARRARKRNRNPPRSLRRGSAPKGKLRWLLYLALLALGASSLALPQVQRLLREQGLGEAADRAERVSSGVSKVATRVGGRARSAAERLGIDDALGSEGTPSSGPQATAETVQLRTTNTDGGSALAYLPPRAVGEARPLIVWLHDAGSSPRKSLELLKPLAEHFRFAVLAPDAHARDGSGSPRWAVGPDTVPSDDEHHVLYCLAELSEDPRFTLDTSHVLLAARGEAVPAALHLATRSPHFTDVALLSEGAPTLDGLGERKPTVFVGASEPLKRAREKLRALGYEVRPVSAAADKPRLLGEVESLLPLWLLPKTP